MLQLMLIAGLGGFLGSCCRFLVSRLCLTYLGSTFPWGTILVNVLGSFLIGIVFGLVEKSNIISTSMNVFLITGFCGGFSTFAAVSGDMFILLQNKQWLYFILYVTFTFALGLLFVWLGRSIITK